MTTMPEPLEKFAKWLDKWKTIISVLIALVGVGVVLGVVKGDTEAMRERITSLERKLERSEVDRDMLIRIDENVKIMIDRIKQLEAKKP